LYFPHHCNRNQGVPYKVKSAAGICGKFMKKRRIHEGGGNGKGKGRNRKTKGTMERKKGEMCGKYDKIKPKRRAEGQITALHEGGGVWFFEKEKVDP
jgi:hypothetical protein